MLGCDGSSSVGAWSWSPIRGNGEREGEYDEERMFHPGIIVKGMYEVTVLPLAPNPLSLVLDDFALVLRRVPCRLRRRLPFSYQC
jgi:hypothetical protein